VVHAAGEPKGRGTVAVWLRAAEGLDDVKFAAWREDFSAARAGAKLADGVVTLEVAGEKGALRIEADVAKAERRVLAGGEPDALLSVNGREVGRPLLAEFLAK
jgi:hypothetical protein